MKTAKSKMADIANTISGQLAADLAGRLDGAFIVGLRTKYTCFRAFYLMRF
jgi:hypothetical protein